MIVSIAINYWVLTIFDNIYFYWLAEIRSMKFMCTALQTRLIDMARNRKQFESDTEGSLKSLRAAQDIMLPPVPTPEELAEMCSELEVGFHVMAVK